MELVAPGRLDEFVLEELVQRQHPGELDRVAGDDALVLAGLLQESWIVVLLGQPRASSGR